MNLISSLRHRFAIENVTISSDAFAFPKKMFFPASPNAGMERTQIISDRGSHVVVENNLRVTYHRDVAHGYGTSPNFRNQNAQSETLDF
jgi:hypothetical protein